MRFVAGILDFGFRWEILLVEIASHDDMHVTRLRLTSQRLKFNGNGDLNPVQRSKNGFTTLTPS